MHNRLLIRNRGEARGDAASAADYNNLVTEWQYISETMGSLQTEVSTLFDDS